MEELCSRMRFGTGAGGHDAKVGLNAGFPLLYTHWNAGLVALWVHLFAAVNQGCTWLAALMLFI